MVMDWDYKNLGDIAEIRMCRRIFAEQTMPMGDVPFFKIGTFGKKPDAYITRRLYEEYKDKYSFPQKGDILLSAAGTLGRTVMYDGKPSYFQDSNIVWLEIKKDQISNNYLYYYYQVIKWASPEGSTISRLYNNIIRNTKIMLPSLPEQQAIASALADVDGYINALEQLIVKKQNIKKGAMQELLIGKRRLPGFNDLWIDIELGNPAVSTILKGSALSKSKLSSSGTFKCILYGELFTKYTELIHNIFSYTDHYEGVLSRKGDVLIPGSTTTTGIDLARASSIPFDNVLIGGDINIVRPNMSIIDSNFLAYYITHIKEKEIALLSKGITVYHLHGKDLAELLINIPTRKEEQIAIAKILSDMDAEINALTEKLLKARNLKQGMMQELLTGRIRLIDEEAREDKASVQQAAATNVVEFLQKDSQLVLNKKSGHNQQFDDAVTIAGIVNALYSDKYPLGRKKVQKCLYLLRRYQDESTKAFKKKAAGPYADEIRYKGGEPIAIQQKYIQTKKGDKGTRFSIGPKIDSALQYLKNWGKVDDMQWVGDTLRYKSIDDLELLATIDMAICDLEEANISVSVASIKQFIQSDREWKKKLKRQTFSDKNIKRAIRELQTLFRRGN